MRGLPTTSPSARNLIAHPYFRPIVCLVGFLLLMQAIKSQWSSIRGGKHPAKEGSGKLREQLVVAHFMLGNTYPFTEDDWRTTFDQAEETGLDALALNIGPEDWQHTQALSAFRILDSRPERFTPPSTSSFAYPRPSKRKLQLFISMDMDALPKWSAEDGDSLRIKVVELMRQESYLRWEGQRVLSTFSGHDATFGGIGWEGWLKGLNGELGEKTFFWPSFFLPPEDLLSIPYTDGIFNWNAAWPLTNTPTSLKEDDIFLTSCSRKSRPSTSRKAYMTSVSPLFFTHYGTTGQWAWNKNWIFPSDRLLYPSRWTQLLALEEDRRPDIIQIVSWNDHGESHAIAPVLGAQPGSEKWTDGMDHEAFREMTAYFINRWKGSEEVEGDVIKVWMWYRTHPKDLVAEGDDVGQPKKADWAEDLINLVVVVPRSVPRNAELVAVVRNGGEKKGKLERGKANILTMPFVPGSVDVEVKLGDRTILTASGKGVNEVIEQYNFNMWSGAWAVKLDGL